MYAIIEVGAKQYNVKQGDILDIEKQPYKEGKEIVLDKVLLLSKDKIIEVGQPYLKNVSVKAEVLRDILTAKTISFKYRRRKSSHWRKGHRQQLIRIKVKEIEAES